MQNCNLSVLLYGLVLQGHDPKWIAFSGIYLDMQTNTAMTSQESGLLTKFYI